MKFIFKNDTWLIILFVGGLYLFELIPSLFF